MPVGRRGISHSEVKSICDSLECSPSQHDDSLPFKGHPNVSPGGKAASANGMHLSTPESEMHFTRNTKIAGFSGKFAGPARQE
jgi:hypothetical protein